MMDEQNSHEQLDKILLSHRAIQTNCQFLTFMRKLTDQQSIAHMPMIQAYSSQVCKLNYDNFAQLLIQVTYMVFSCKYYGLNPRIEKESLRIEENPWHKKITVFIYYKIVEEAVESGYYSKFVENLLRHLLGFFVKEIQNDQNSQKSLAVQYLTSFAKMFNYFSSCLEQLSGDERDRKFFMLLEETDLFREYSLLLKIKNNSMVDLISGNMNWFKQYKKRDVEAVIAYNSTKKKNKYDPIELKNKEGVIESNINQFLAELANKMNAKLDGLKETDIDQVFKVKKRLYIDGKTQSNTIQRLSRIDSRFSGMMEEGPTQKPNPFQYQIQYSSEKNSICVKLILHNICLSLQASDYILIQSNVLTFDIANISVECFEAKNPEENSLKRVIAFRGASCFNSKQPPLEKILLLMDLTMIAAKIYEPELSVNRGSYQSNDYQRIGIVYQKMEHYTKILLKCAKKVYND